MQHNIDVNKHNFGKTSLLHAIKSGCIQCVQLLVDHGADVNYSFGRSCPQSIYYAFKKHQKNKNTLINLIKILIKAGVSVQIDLGSEMPLLKWALTYSDQSRELVPFLLQKGALVWQEMIDNEKDEATKLLLQKYYDKQRCCICFESTAINVPCMNKHNEFMCRACCNKVRECPLCREKLFEIISHNKAKY